MKRAITTVLSGIVLSTLLATSAFAADQKSSNQTTTLDPERVYVEKYGA